jgi:F-type H+-transporting ATPase subunit delta
MKASQATAGRYAKALYAVARETGGIESVGQELATFLDLFTTDPALAGVLQRPWIKPSERQGIATDVARGAGFSKLVQDFMGLLAARGRMDHLGEIVDGYRALVDQDLGRVHGEVRTATPLTDAERQQLATRLGRSLGKQVVLRETLDRSLLGGFVAQVGSFILDGSLDGRLQRLRERLARG